MTQEPGTISPEPLAVRFDDDSFWVDLADGRTLGIPLVWFPKLLQFRGQNTLFSRRPSSRNPMILPMPRQKPLMWTQALVRG